MSPTEYPGCPIAKFSLETQNRDDPLIEIFINIGEDTCKLSFRHAVSKKEGPYNKYVGSVKTK